MIPIYTSKIFRASKRQAAILAAMHDPINAELVTQVASYLDAEYRNSKYLDPDYEEHSQDNDNEANDTSSNENESAARMELDDSMKPEMDDSFNPRDNLVSIPESSEELDDMLNQLSETDSESSTSDTEGADTSNESSTGLVNESSRVVGSPVLGSVDISDVPLNLVQGTLNSRESTGGVLRCSIINSEMWIFYNDSVNLNNIMVSVINLLSDSGFNYLSFNRLARSENAMVFVINISTDNNTGRK